MQHSDADTRFLPHLLCVAAEKVEAFLDTIEPSTDRDFIQLRAPLEAILQNTTGTFSLFLHFSLFSAEKPLAPVWIQPCLEDTPLTSHSPLPSFPKTHRAPDGLIQTTSKSYVYTLDATTPALSSLDLREWFDDVAPRKRQRRRHHAFVEACLRETGGPSNLSADELRLLEDFIVPSEGRDYDETFRRRFRFVDASP